MIESLLMGLAAALLLLAFLASRQSDEFRITRSLLIHASAANIFPHVNDLYLWQAWSPWAKLDPSAKNTFSGPQAGEGASTSWVGNSKVGEGSMTITQSHPSDFIQFRLDFRKPMKATNTAEFTFKPEGPSTLVSWSMYGKNTFMGKVMSIVFNCDKMIGTQFEKGLASLKTIAEGAK